ncbi:FusB/FusC family EF-G-binding protein [Paenibacillus sp. Leaf72]|uniref:FusB/FusC family EF-G-binding protein n=1 Tax=Paenibacillus sp. Leaf72 TaxID=1736234 RepID=UPI0006F8DD04|nr:FusB/FusC family EF-G-binding protein [Paenibacillus sp. Leaf72]KQO01392.1 fibronectin-binding protein [Paenibacillus sp. Leaf72]
MSKPFIRNHQYNVIKKQAGILQHALGTVADRKILESVKYTTESKIMEMFPDAAAEQKQMLEAVSTLRTKEDFAKYLRELEGYLTEFPTIMAKQIQKLFPKNKKLKLPDLAAIDYRYVTYLSWIDIASNKLFIVYPVNGQFVGVEGRYNPTNKKNYCFVCNRFEELALFSAITKKRPAGASPDYYKAVGNYMCAKSHDCNNNITDTTALEKFIEAVVG